MAIQSRLTSLDQSQMDDAQRAALNQILNGPRGNLDGPFLAWIQSDATCCWITGIQRRHDPSGNSTCRWAAAKATFSPSLSSGMQ